MSIFSNKEWVRYSPIVASVLIESSTLGHILRMWQERTSAGQALLSWFSIIFALLVWMNYYRVFLPTEKWAKWSTMFALCTVSFATFTVIYFRYMV